MNILIGLPWVNSFLKTYNKKKKTLTTKALFQSFYMAIKPNNTLYDTLPTHSQFVDAPIDEPWEQ